ncbi:MAG: hypothetical protein WAU23_08275 [Ferruginibacter sp.]
MLIYEEYLFSTTITICDPGGGGGGSQCNFTSEQGLILLSYMTYEHSTFASSYIGNPTSSSNGVIRAPKPISWQFLTLHPFANYYPKYSAYFSGTVYKLNANDPSWKWETVSFGHAAKSGGEVPPCFTIVVTASATSVISGNELSVLLDLNYQSTTTVTCLFGIEVATYNGTLTHPGVPSNGPPGA